MSNVKKLKSQKTKKCSNDAYDKGIAECVRKLRTCAVSLERDHLAKRSADRGKNNRLNVPKTCSRVSLGKAREPVPSARQSIKCLKRLRPCAVRLERLVHSKIDSNHDVIRRYGVRPCKVVINKLHSPADLGLECRVMLEPIRYADITITRLPSNFREVYYTVKNFDCDDSTQFVDWRLETIKALPRTGTAGNRAGKDFFSKELPLVLADVFDVNGIKDTLPSILLLLSGGKMSSLVLDAYLFQFLERFKQENEQKQVQSRRRNSTGYKNWTKFQLLSVFYFPCFKVKGSLHCPPKPYVETAPNLKLEPDTILIAPQYICAHFYLTIFDFPSKIVHVIDSSWNYVKEEFRQKQVESVLRYLLQSSPHLAQDWDQWFINKLENCAQQNDEFSCGCYLIRFVENLLSGLPTNEASLRKLSKAEILDIRRKIVRELLPTTDIGRQILEGISE